MTTSNPFVLAGIERIRSKWPQAHFERDDTGQYLVVVPGFVLPPGYRQTICTVMFIVPAGFPGACPAHFFTDIELTLAESRNANPRNTVRWHPELKEGNFPARQWPAWERAMFWSMQLQAWNPNTDSLLTYLHVIERRIAIEGERTK